MTVKPITPDDYHYGAVEALAADIAFDAGIFGPLEGGARDHFMEKAANRIRALEAAGYRVVGPEPTEAMLESADAAFMHDVGLEDILRSIIAAAPTLTEQKP